MEIRREISGIDEQNLPGAVAINEQQGPVDTAFIEAMRARDKAIVEDGTSPTTHPLRSKGGWLAPEVSDFVSSPELRSELSMIGRE